MCLVFKYALLTLTLLAVFDAVLEWFPSPLSNSIFESLALSNILPSFEQYLESEKAANLSDTPIKSALLLYRHSVLDQHLKYLPHHPSSKVSPCHEYVPSHVIFNQTLECLSFQIPIVSPLGVDIRDLVFSPDLDSLDLLKLGSQAFEA